MEQGSTPVLIVQDQKREFLFLNRTLELLKKSHKVHCFIAATPSVCDHLMRSSDWTYCVTSLQWKADVLSISIQPSTQVSGQNLVTHNPTDSAI